MSDRPKLWVESRVTVETEEVVDVQSDAWLTALRRASTVYCDGGVFRPRRCEVGSWAWVATDRDDQEVACQYGWVECGPSTPDGITNNLSELTAVMASLVWMCKATPRWSGRLCSDSQVTLGRVSQGWKMRGVPQRWVERVAEILERVGDIEFVHLKGHPTRADLAAGFKLSSRGDRTYPVSHHQVKCDRLCNEVLEQWSRVAGITR
jgi:ribonuclease HI